MEADLEKNPTIFCQKKQTNFSVCLIHYKFEFELQLDDANLIRPNFDANFLAERIILKQPNFSIIDTEVC